MYYTADFLLCSGTSPESKAIKIATKSDFSHVGLIFTYECNGVKVSYVIEAIQPKIAVIPLEQYFTNYQQTGKPYPGQLYLGRIAGGLTDEQKKIIHNMAIKQIGKNYDTASLVKQAFNAVFGTDFQDRDNHRLICSELAAMCYKAAGIELKKDQHNFTTPASICRDERIIIAKLKDYEA